jgi:hypothetical protein
MRCYQKTPAALALVLTLAVATGSNATETSASLRGRDDDRAAVLAVVEQFRTAIIAKDKARLDSLFLPAGVSWVQVLGPKLYGPGSKAPDAQPVAPGTQTAFSDFVAGEKQRVEERFSGLDIKTDGALATVYFNYDFLLNDKVSNSGQETWQLVKAPTGWKISAVAYSITSAAN